VLNPPPQFGTPEVISHGADTYNRFCGTCHGTDGQSRGLFPDLRYSGALNSAEVFHSIVIDGALSANGMVSFKTALTESDVNSIRAYVVSRSHDAVKNGPGGMAAMQQQRSGPAPATGTKAADQKAAPEASH
jgi:mono/diheme cytochrome c family protein